MSARRARLTAVALIACVSAAVGWMPAQGATGGLEIDAFDYRTASEARAAWKALGGSPAPRVAPAGPWGSMRLTEFPCDYSVPARERCYWDRAVDLDLSAYHCFGLRLYCRNPTPIDGLTLYFRSGGGWYAGHAGSLRRGWNDIVVERSEFTIEGSPAGWDSVDGIRLSPWRGRPTDTTIYADRLWAYTPEILVVKGTQTEAAWGEEVEQYCRPFLEWLEEYGARVGMITDEDVEAGLLEGSSLAVLAYNPVMPTAEIEQIEEYVAKGGKLFACYDLETRITDLLGVRRIGYDDRDVCAMTFDNASIAGLPSRADQSSWNFMRVTPAASSTVTIAKWESCEGVALKHAAMLSAPAGVYLSHVLLGDGPAEKKQMLTAIVAHYVPTLAKRLADAVLERSGQVGPYASFDRACGEIESAGPRSLHPQEVAAEVATARREHSAARQALASKNYPGALGPGFAARWALMRAYALIQRPRRPELRAVWNHSGTGVWAGDWRRSTQQLATSGFTAVFPNMMWGGLAHYPSQYLPRSQVFRRYGDQVAQCLAACRVDGLQMHVWKVNWNLSGAPENFLRRMRSLGRTQVDAFGGDVDWLCPSDPRNQKLEADSMLEVVTKYGVDGIHFDYIRYPDETTCYCNGCRGRFEEYRGRAVVNWPGDCYDGSLHDEYRDWRALQITTLVSTVHDRVKALKPEVVVSAAVFGDYPECRESVGQDWLGWVKAGYLDCVLPMDYTGSAQEFSASVARQLRQVKGLVPLYPGIGASSESLTGDQVILQILETRSHGARGFCLFDYDRYLSGTILDLLAKGVTFPGN